MGPAATLSILVKAQGAAAAAAEIRGVDSAARGASGNLDKASSAARKHSGVLSGLGKVAGLAGLAMGGAGLAKGISSAISEYREAQKVGNQTNAVLKSTGGAAGVTKKHIENLAGAISKKSGIDDEAIQSGENLLLTFTGIRNEVGKGNNIFDQATQTITDMSVALGQSGKSSAIQLGKALNDPIKGITALRRVGVAFTDQQKKQIETLTKSGDKLGAQKIILKELTKEFGGSAAAQATSGDKLKVALSNLAEAAGSVLVPALDKIARFMTNVINQFVEGKGIATVIIPIFQNLATVIGDVVKVIVGLVKGFQEGNTWATLIGTAIIALTAGLVTYKVVVGTIEAATRAWAAAQLLLNLAVAANPFVIAAAAIVALGVALVIAYNKVDAFHKVVDDTFSFIKDHWPLLLGILTGPIGLAVVAIITHAGNIKKAIVGAFNAIVGAVHDLASAYVALGAWVIAKIVEGAKAAFAVVESIGAWLGYHAMLGIHAAAEALTTVGGWVTSTLVNGAKAAFTVVEGIGAWMRYHIDQGLTDAKNGFIALGGSVIGWIVDGLKAGAINVQNFLNDIIDIINKLPMVEIKHINVIGKAKGGAYGSGPIPAGLARGGAFARTGGKVTSPITLMGEEAPRHPEYVIPTNPAYKDRALNLLGQAGKAIGLAGGGTFMSSAYGPPWGGIQGTGVTATGVDLRGNPSIYGIAIDPSVLKLGSSYNVQPNPFGTSAGFKAFDTGGAIKGNRIDFYDWRGRDFQNAWGMRNVQVSGGGGGGGVLGAIGGLVGSVGGILGDLLSKGAGFLTSQLPGTGNLPDWLKGTGSYILDKVKDWIKNKVSDLTGGLLGGGGGSTGPKGVGTFNGVPMANWVIDALKYAQGKGVAVRPTSGYRPGFDPHTASGASEHQGTQYPHGAVDFGGYHDAAAKAMKMAVVNATSDFKWPLLAPFGFVDDGHASGTGHKMGGVFSRYVGAFANGGVVPQTGLAMVHKGETISPAGATTVVEHHYHGPVVQDKDFIQYLRNIDRNYGRQNGRPAFGG